MARTVRDTKLETRTARAKLAVRGKPYYKALDPGLHLGYRRGKRGGKWVVRWLDGKNSYKVATIAIADDKADPDGEDVLNFSQAQAKARARVASPAAGPYSVASAMRDYLAWYKAHRKPSGLEFARYTNNAHIKPELGDIEVAKLTPKRLREWHEKLAMTPARVRPGRGKPQTYREAPADVDGRRARQATANRILTVLKAGLTRAYHDELVASDEAWRRVKPFRAVNAAKVRYLTEDECARLSNACAPEFRPLVQAALLTGCRYGELIALRCDDYNADGGTIAVREAKGGRPRHVPLNDAGVAFFERITAGRPADETMFLKDDESPWGRSHQARPLRVAAQAAKIVDVSFHDLRHTYGSMLAMRGVPMGVIAVALGHADERMTQQHYAHLAPSYVADTIRANLPDFGIKSDKKVARLKR